MAETLLRFAVDRRDDEVAVIVFTTRGRCCTHPIPANAPVEQVAQELRYLADLLEHTKR